MPLHEAANRGYYNIIETLLALNAPARPRTNKDDTPEDLAYANKHYACAQLLREYKQPAAKTSKEEWYHGTLDRNEANQIFHKYGVTQPNNVIRDGTYLVRYSERNNNANDSISNGNYVLTMMAQNKTYHYIIGRKVKFYFLIINNIKLGLPPI